MNLNATAKANGSSADATATANEALVQDLNGTTFAGAQIDNHGTINIDASAVATATSGEAIAHALVEEPIHQTANAASASAIFINGTAAAVNMTASAKANGASFASASA